MLRADGRRGRLARACVAAALLLVSLGVARHVHARDAAAPSATCLVCSAAEHGVSDLPVMALLDGPPARRLRPPALRPAERSVRFVVACPSRAPPAPAPTSRH